MGLRNWSLFGCCLIFSAVLLSACEPDEQDRTLWFEPGVYQGQEDAPLTEEKLNTLRQRARNQGAL
jgi:hypothetical protein